MVLATAVKATESSKKHDYKRVERNIGFRGTRRNEGWFVLLIFDKTHALDSTHPIPDSQTFRDLGF